MLNPGTAEPFGQQRKLKKKLTDLEAAPASSLKIGILKVARLSARTLVIIFVHSMYIE